MNADMQLARTVDPGWINLAIGEPAFLQDIYGPLYPKGFYGPYIYPPLAGEPELISMLEKRHPGKRIILTTGAKQGLYAAIYACNELNRYSQVAHQAPYWPSYPTIALFSCLPFKELSDYSDDRREYDGTLRIITIPNNPDGNIVNRAPSRMWDIHDAAYYSPIYSGNQELPEVSAQVSVWSAAKLWGMSSYRIGWLATEDKRLADIASEYVEKTTSGVSMPAQIFLRDFLRTLNTMSDNDRAKLENEAIDHLREMRSNFRIFAQAVGHTAPLNESGMFGWLQPKEPERFREALAKAQVKVVSGTACGATDDWFRLSLGVSAVTFREAIARILRARY